jgi:hypothetical protein
MSSRSECKRQCISTSPWTRKYPREVYSLSYMGHMKGLVYVYIHHRDEGTEKTSNLRGSLYDFFVGIDEDSGEVRAEGALQ